MAAKNSSDIPLMKFISICVTVAVLITTCAFSTAMFVISENYNRDAANLDRAVLLCTEAAEQFKVHGAGLIGSQWVNDGQAQVTGTELLYTLEFFYDREWNPVGQRDPSGFSLIVNGISTATEQPQGGMMLKADIRIVRHARYALESHGGKVVYRISASKFEQQ